MRKVTNTPCCSVSIELLPTRILTSHLCRKASSGSTMIDAISIWSNRRICDIVFFHGFIKCQTIYAKHIAMNKITLIQLVHDTKDSTCSVALLHTITLCIRSQHTKTRYFPTQKIDIVESKINFSLLRNCQQMQYRIRASAHGNV